ncbi:hypothetical protein [uncultured Adlercreutzia sp.]|jgi:hypothetical protein|uniref:hypothetical protein n=1 Tax=uncultured Adlercreutzia sp. TaxID=875803 RepID=UPI00272DE334|nr:hypothetical protein [uncultured Adlercreutzia sp.]
MNYTKNYRLPQWVKEDRIMMDDFNAAMASMESGMTASTSIANTAKQTADAAKQRVDTAYTPDNKPYAVGTYVGTGGTPQAIELGFMPSFILISTYLDTSDPLSAGGKVVAVSRDARPSKITFTKTGFEVAEGSQTFPNVNVQGWFFTYIAFR